MNKSWDNGDIAFSVDFWREALRVIKPGGHMLAFGSPRTYHRMVSAIEDAGWEIRDTIQWVHGQGFPKNLDVSKAIDKAAGAERERVCPVSIPRRERNGTNALGGGWQDEPWETAPATEAARQWEGWGTALKPAVEDWWLVRKPLRGTVAGNVLEFGTGALNIDASRVPTDERITPFGSPKRSVGGILNGTDKPRPAFEQSGLGRWPSHWIMSHSPGCNGACVEGCPVRLMDEQSGERTSGSGAKSINRHSAFGDGGWRGGAHKFAGDSGTASRFFLRLPADPFVYQSKPATSERERGLEHRARRKVNDGRQATADNPRLRGETERGNTHPTVKSVHLMQYLCRLVTPPGGRVLDCFGGSGSTGVGCLREGFECVLIEMEEEHCDIARERIYGEAPLFAEVNA